MKKIAASQNALSRPGANYKVTTPGKKSQKRDKMLSPARDSRADRGIRQIKTTLTAKSLFREGELSGL